MDPNYKFPIYLLTKSGENDRIQIATERIWNQFQRPFKITLGLDRKKIEEVQKVNFKLVPGFTVKAGSMCCLDGHSRMMMDFLDSKDECCLLLEDDVIFTVSADEFSKVVNDVDDAFTHWDWIHCGGYQYEQTAVPHPVLFKDGDPEHWRSDTFKVARAKECGWCTTCIFYSRAGAKKFLSLTEEVTAPGDCYTRFLQEGVVAFNATSDMYYQDWTMRSFINPKNT